MNNTQTFIIGLVLGVALTLASFTESDQNNPTYIGKKLEEFKRTEEICGVGNVRDKCKAGICGSEIGFTCYHFRKAVHNERGE